MLELDSSDAGVSVHWVHGSDGHSDAEFHVNVLNKHVLGAAILADLSSTVGRFDCDGIVKVGNVDVSNGHI